MRDHVRQSMPRISLALHPGYLLPLHLGYLLGVTRQHLHRILAETAPVSPEMALRLGKFCGNGPGLWLRMQQAYDLWHAERAMRKEIAKIPTAKERAA